jgi:hypothetical protein
LGPVDARFAEGIDVTVAAGKLACTETEVTVTTAVLPLDVVSVSEGAKVDVIVSKVELDVVVVSTGVGVDVVIADETTKYL